LTKAGAGSNGDTPEEAKANAEKADAIYLDRLRAGQSRSIKTLERLAERAQVPIIQVKARVRVKANYIT
jgi:predicted RNase H-like HicB family nuclease